MIDDDEDLASRGRATAYFNHGTDRDRRGFHASLLLPSLAQPLHEGLVKNRAQIRDGPAAEFPLQRGRLVSQPAIARTETQSHFAIRGSGGHMLGPDRRLAC